MTHNNSTGLLATIDALQDLGKITRIEFLMLAAAGDYAAAVLVAPEFIRRYNVTLSELDELRPAMGAAIMLSVTGSVMRRLEHLA